MSDERPLIAITLDDGPGPWTYRIAEILERAGSRGTFFVLGAHAEQRPDVIEVLHANGHELAVHGWSHLGLRSAKAGALAQEAGRCCKLLLAITGHHPIHYRAPWGETHPTLEFMVKNLGLTTVGVELDGFDCTRTFDSVMNTLRTGLKPGSIVTLHDAVAPNGTSRNHDRSVTALVVEALCETYRSVPLRELLR